MPFPSDFVRLSHAPVWRRAAGNGYMSLRPTGHAVRVWANSGVNIDGSNWRTAQRGISYISVPSGSFQNTLACSGEKKSLFGFSKKKKTNSKRALHNPQVMSFAGHNFIDWRRTKLSSSE